MREGQGRSGFEEGRGTGTGWPQVSVMVTWVPWRASSPSEGLPRPAAASWRLEFDRAAQVSGKVLSRQPKWELCKALIRNNQIETINPY